MIGLGGLLIALLLIIVLLMVFFRFVPIGLWISALAEPPLNWKPSVIRRP